ncbi:hypothetical protein CD798_17305, partial [Bacillaceae bacterium SAOS 7]
DADQADDSDQDTDDADDESDDVENDLEDNPGYSGKFKALQNRLNAVTNRLDSLSAKAIDEVALTERYDRVKALQSEVGAVLLTINQIQDKVTKEIEQDDAVEEKESVKEKDLMKEWKIQFSKALDEKTLSELDIIVLDQDKNLVETTFTYSVATKSVTISPLQPYQSGKTYTLYIGKKISSKEGKGLKNSVKMNFSIQ